MLLKIKTCIAYLYALFSGEFRENRSKCITLYRVEVRVALLSLPNAQEGPTTVQLIHALSCASSNKLTGFYSCCLFLATERSKKNGGGRAIFKIFSLSAMET